MISLYTVEYLALEVLLISLRVSIILIRGRLSSRTMHTPVSFSRNNLCVTRVFFVLLDQSSPLSHYARVLLSM